MGQFMMHMTASFVGGFNPNTWERERYINVGHFMLAIDPNRFGLEGSFEDRMDQLIDMLHDTPAASVDEPVMVAGDPERKAREERLANGIPMMPKLVFEVSEVARAAGAEVVLPEIG